MKAYLTLSFLLLSFLSFCQFQLSGTVTDSSNQGVGYASVALTSAGDSSTLQFVITKEDGSFQMSNIDSAEYSLVVGSYGFDVSYTSLLINQDITDYTIVVHSAAISLQQVLFKAPAIPILISGDTVIYNANSFKTQSNATVEDLIKKMPGITVNKDGTITTEGEGVTKILINGKEFFGGNIEAATKNLDASLVDKLEVIDRKTDDDEFTGDEGSEREKVINLVLKEDQAQGYFGTLRGGYGLKDLYDVKGNVNFFKGATQLSIIGGLNNINRRLYGWQEMSSLQSFEISPFNNWNRMTWWNSGIATRKGVGANLHIEPGKHVKADVSYVISDESSVKETQNTSEIYLDSSVLFYQKNERSNGGKDNHELNTKIELEDSLSRLVIRAKYSSELSGGLNSSRSFNYLELPMYLNSGVNQDDQESGNDRYAVKVHWTLKSKKKPKNHLLVSAYVGRSKLSSLFHSYFQTVDQVLLPFPTDEEAIVQQDLHSDEKTFATTTAYQIQLTDKLYIRPGFNWLTSTYQHDYQWKQNAGELVKNQSPMGTARAQNMEYYMHISYKLDSFTTLHIVPELNQNIESREFATDSNYTYDFNRTFFIPYMFMRGTKPHKYSWRFHVRANVQKPSIYQVLPITDNSNPYVTSIGNIKLQNYIRYSNSWNYRRIMGLGKSLSFHGWNSYTEDGVVNKTTITPENYRITEAINYKNSFNTNNGITLYLPIKAIKAEWGLGVGYSYNSSFFIRNEEEIRIKNQSYNLNAEMSFNQFDYWGLEMGYNFSLNQGSIDGISNNAFPQHGIYAALLLTPIPSIELSSELDWDIYGSNSVVGVTSIPILTAEFSWYVDKAQRWAVGIKAFDLLDKNQNIWRYWAGNTFTEFRNNSIQRYVLGTLAYKIKKPAKEAAQIP